MAHILFVLRSISSIVIIEVNVYKRKSKHVLPRAYCDQPFASETTRCVSDDVIKTIDYQGQNVRGFYVWGKWSGRELNSGETEKENV